jgi:hypothetical protein
VDVSQGRDGEHERPAVDAREGAGEATAPPTETPAGGDASVEARDDGAADDRSELARPVATDAPSRRRRLFGVAGFIVVAAVAMHWLLPNTPHEQRVRMHLGAGSSRLVHATARIRRVDVAEWEREAEFPFEPGRGAPPAFDWRFSLPNGAAHVEVELATRADVTTGAADVALEGGEAVVELAPTLARLP